jgi:hypothetical protein
VLQFGQEPIMLLRGARGLALGLDQSNHN